MLQLGSSFISLENAVDLGGSSMTTEAGTARLGVKKPCQASSVNKRPYHVGRVGASFELRT
jgi:hypothetical protein